MEFCAGDFKRFLIALGSLFTADHISCLAACAAAYFGYRSIVLTKSYSDDLFKRNAPRVGVESGDIVSEDQKNVEIQIKFKNYGGRAANQLKVNSFFVARNSDQIYCVRNDNYDVEELQPNEWIKFLIRTASENATSAHFLLLDVEYIDAEGKKDFSHSVVRAFEILKKTDTQSQINLALISKELANEIKSKTASRTTLKEREGRVLS